MDYYSHASSNIYIKVQQTLLGKITYWFCVFESTDTFNWATFFIIQTNNQMS